MNRKMKFLAVLAVLVFGLILSACGGGQPATPAQPPAQPAGQQGENQPAEEAPEVPQFEVVNLRVAYMPNMNAASSIATALKMGFFEEQGLNVEVVEFQSGPPAIAAMAGGDIDIAQIGHGAHALAIEGQAVIFQLDTLSLSDAVIGNRNRGIETAEDLRGATIAATSGTSAEIILDLTLEAAGISRDEIEFIEMDAVGIVTAMISGSIDAAATWSPGTVTIRTQMGDNAVTLATNEDFLHVATFPSSFVTTENFVANNRDVLVRFAAAIKKAHDFRNADPEESARLVARMMNVDEAIIVQESRSGIWITSDYVLRGLDDGTIVRHYENQQRIFIAAGRIEEEVDVNEYILFDIMREANAAMVR